MKPLFVRSSAPLRQQGGAATLVVVALLFVAMAILAAFTSRSLLFEQKTSANQYRSTLAIEAAEAGLEWATGMLNRSGKINGTCAASAAVADTTFRLKYLAVHPDTGVLTPNAAAGVAHAACVANPNGTGWNCSCPAAGTEPTPAAPVATTGFAPGFAVTFVATAGPAGTVQLISRGCSSAITNVTCGGDAAATVRVVLGQVSGLASPPGAPLTARGEVNIGNAALGVQNGDPATHGVTINAGMGVKATALRITTVPGTPPHTSLVGNDDSLRNTTEDQMFQTFFGVPKATYRESVADHVQTCSPNCSETDVVNAYNAGKRKMWFNGNLRMNANLTIGSDTDPFVLITDGGIEMRGDLRLFGVFYSTAITWDNTGGGSALVQGAVISEGNYSGNGTPDYYYDPRIFGKLTRELGSFVRLPGSWRDF